MAIDGAQRTSEGAAFSYGKKDYLLDAESLRFWKLPAETPLFDPPVAPLPEHAGHTGVNFITLNVAHDCNMKCPYCFAKQGMYGGPRQLMTAETATRSVDWLLSSSGTKVDCYLRFLGGEPFMNVPVMRETMIYGRRRAEEFGKQLHFSVNTNGTYFNSEIRDLLREFEVVVSVSMDGTREAHNRFRIFNNGSGTYDTVVRNLDKFLEIDPYLLINGTLTNENLDVDEYAELFRSLGVRLIRFAMVGTTVPGIAVRRDQKLQQVLGAYDRLAIAYERDIRNGQVWYLADVYRYFSALRSLSKRTHRCGAGTSFTNIDVNGDVHLCHRFTADKSQVVGHIGRASLRIPSSIARMNQLEPSLGSIPSGTPAPIERDPQNREPLFLHRHLSGAPLFAHDRSLAGQANPCHVCDIRHLCGGACYHDGESLFGDLHGGPDAFKCEVDRHLVKIAVWLLDAMEEASPAYFGQLESMHKRSIQHHT